MKKYCSILAALCFLFISVSPVFAHALLPKDLIEFLKNNPNATVLEIQQFAASSSIPAVREFGGSSKKVIEILRNRDTSFLDNAYDFMKLGINHILSGPDHILFVLSLLLSFISIGGMLKLSGAFTFAHSITLLLAGTGILTLSSRIVEPFIAFSIAYVALSGVFFKPKSVGDDPPSFWRGAVPVVFFFGLFHGLGFAGLLKEIQIPVDRFVSSLVSFNIGIELGQLVIIACALPFIYLCRNKTGYPWFIKIAAGLLGAIGLFWMIQRIFFAG